MYKTSVSLIGGALLEFKTRRQPEVSHGFLILYFTKSDTYYPIDDIRWVLIENLKE
jgi:hypothetical protein